MPQINTPSIEDTGRFYTNYTGSINEASQTFTFTDTQNGMTFSNKGKSVVILTVDGVVNRVPPQATIEIDDSAFTSFDVRTQSGTQDFTIKAFREKSNVSGLGSLQSQVSNLSSQLAQKASKDDIANIGNASPKGTYATLSALQTAFPTGNNGIYVVTADGKWYYWNGTAWTAGGQYQSTGIADKAVTQAKTNFIQKIEGKNKIDPARIRTDLRFSPGGNNITDRSTTTYCATGFLEVEEGKTYVYSGQSILQQGGYFSSSATEVIGQAAISAITFTVLGSVGNWAYAFTVPTGQNIKYVFLNLTYDTATNSVLGKQQLELGSAPTALEDYVAYNKVLNPLIESDFLKKVVNSSGGINTEMLQNGVVTPEKVSFMERVSGKNKINPANIRTDMRYSPGGVKIDSGAGTIYGATGFIEVIEGEWYTYTGSALINSGGYFAADAILQIGQSAISNITFSTPVDGNGLCFQVPIGLGVKYVFLNIHVDTTTRVVQGTLQLEKGEQGTTIESYEEFELIKKENIPPVSSVQTPSTSLDNKSWFNFLEGVSYGDITSKISNFRKHWIQKDKDLVVAMTGTSLTARSSEHSTLLTDEKSRPPLFHSNNFASHAWDKLKWEGQKYRRFDYAGFFTETGTFATQSNIADWDDGAYRFGITRYADGASNVKFVVPINAWQFNFIYRSDIKGSEACTVAIAEGNGKMEVYNGTAWVEANGYVFSMKETEKNLSNLTLPNPEVANNPSNITATTYKIGGNTTYQKRLKMRCKSATIDSRNVVKNVTISTVANRLLYWGVEWSPREFMITFINASRGSHNMTVNSDMGLQHYQDNEIWSFKPDLIFTENPIHNSGGSGSNGGGWFWKYPSSYWGNVTYNFFFNTDSPVSLTSRAAANGITDLEWIIFNSSLAWNFGGIDDNGELIVADDGNYKMITALDAQMATHEWLKENKTDVISINAVKYWVDAGRKIFGDLKTATVGSGKDGGTFTNEGSHWNDTGSKVMAKCILPVFDFII